MPFRPLPLLIFIVCWLPSSAQDACRIERFTTDNGLPSNGIKGLQWDDATGFLWIATEAGITRYNGSDFKTFSKANTPALSSERMLFLLKSQGGRIYTADEAGNIFYIFRNKLQYLSQVSVDARPSAFKLIGLSASSRMFRQSSDHPASHFGFNFKEELLIPVTEERILIFRKDTLYDYRAGAREPVPLTIAPSGSSAFLMRGQLYLYHPRIGFQRFDIDKPGKSPEPVAFTLPDASLTPHRVATSNTLAAVSTHREAWQLFWESGMLHPILLSGSHAYLISYDGRQLNADLICDSVPTDGLISYAGYNEKYDLLFFGTNSKGIILIRRNEVRPVKIDHPSADKVTSTYSQLALSGNAILTSHGDLLGTPPAALKPVITPSFNNYIYRDGDSLLWYSYGDSIYQYAYKSKQTHMFFAGKGSITDGFLRGDSLFYIASSVGIGTLGPDGVAYSYRYPQADVNSNVPFTMAELSPGLIAIGSCNGLRTFDIHTRRLDTLLHAPGLCVRALWKYKGYLFIGTYGQGIYIWKNGVLRAIALDRKGYLAYAHCFVPDSLGYCWISCNKGLFRARLSDMIHAYDTGDQELYYHYYGRNDGMEITELNGGCTPCALALNDSTISFPSMDGLVWVNPNNPIGQLPEGNIYIDEFRADSQLLDLASLVKPSFPSNTREIVLSLGFPAWSNWENIYIDYKLEPYSSQWRPLNLQQTPFLSFSNLPPGEYTLKVRKLNGFGRNNYSITEIAFRISSHWYQQAWSLLLGLGIIVVACTWAFRVRTRRFRARQHRLEQQIAAKTGELKQKNEELERTDIIKTRLISIISHDLVTPLKFLHLAGKSLIEKKSELPEAIQRETITEIMNTSKELELLSTNILNWIKYRNEDRRLVKESFHLQQLVQQLFSLFNSMAKQKGIRLIDQVDEHLLLYQFIEPVRIVLYNLILNAINFSSEGHIVVSSEPAAEGISLIVEDTGVGMTQEQINNIMADHFIISSANVDRRKGNGLGYLIIKDLLKIIRGSLFIQSEKNKGTRVQVLLPTPPEVSANITF